MNNPILDAAVAGSPPPCPVFEKRYHLSYNPNSGRQIRCVLYARVSTKDKGQDTDNQLVQLRGFAEQQGWAVLGEYVDRKSGKSGDRGQFQRLFADAVAGVFDVVMFWALDRFSREGVRETLNYLERLTAAGVGWRSYTEQYLDSCGVFKDAVLAILAVIAKQERIRLSERTLAGLERANRAGRYGGRPRKIVDRSKVLQMAHDGATISAIAAHFGVSRGFAHGVIKGAQK